MKDLKEMMQFVDEEEKKKKEVIKIPFPLLKMFRICWKECRIVHSLLFEAARHLCVRIVAVCDLIFYSCQRNFSILYL